MERKRTTSTKAAEAQIDAEETEQIVEVMSMAQIQGLVKLLDRSDISELEVKQASEGLHLVLRKVKAQEGGVLASEVVTTSGEGSVADSGEKSEKRQNVVAPLVGIFHPWLKPRGGTLAAVGDRVKAGQVVGTIESLNVFNEVEASVAGRVVEIHVQDGQPVEYGQVLFSLEPGEAEGA